jgi:hypothetical protein
MHPAIRVLPNSLPIRYSSISNRLGRVLSALVYWHPPLAECDWLPALVFPFLRMFERDSLALFEFMVTIISNWCSEWLHFIPNPPITVLSRIERICRAHGGDAPLSVTWPALRSFFGEVATTEAALVLFDNIIAAQPVFLEYLVASFGLIQQEKVINERNVIFIVDRARQLYESDSMWNPNRTSFLPLPTGCYPVMPVVQKVPNWRAKEIARIRTEAEASKEEETLNDDIEAESARIERQRRIWMAERSVLREIEEEQMEEFRRREQEILAKEHAKEAVNMRIRREQLRARKAEEEAAMEEWKRDCQRVQDQMQQVSATRRATWANWLTVKEDSAKLAQQEAESELELLRYRDDMHAREIEAHNRAIEQAAKEEADALRLMIERNKALEEERFQLKQKLDEARKLQAVSVTSRRLKSVKV